MAARPGGGKLRNAHAGDVFTISLHQHNNYPMYKPLSSIDVDLPDGIGDDDYLAWLDNALSSGLRQFEPELLCYVAGADPYCEDQLGGLALTIAGLKRRDELVFRVARARDIPVMVTYAGGTPETSRIRSQFIAILCWRRRKYLEDDAGFSHAAPARLDHHGVSNPPYSTPGSEAAHRES